MTLVDRFCPHYNSLLLRSNLAWRKLSGIMGLLLLLLAFFAGLITVSSNVRNYLFTSILPGVWHPISTAQLAKMQSMTGTIDVGRCPKTCPKTYKPRLSVEDVAKQQGIMYYDDGEYDKITYTDPRRRFLSPLSRGEKVALLHAWQVAHQVLTEAGVVHFLVDGSLLGVVRHRGMIPWDDDVDVGLSGLQWREARDALCCVEGFQVALRDNMHWRFFPRRAMFIPNTPDIRFPFVDMFFYREDDSYIWSITEYNLQNLLFRKEDIFPLRSVPFEGRNYPGPKRTDHAIQTQFKDLSMCVSASMLHKYNHALSSSEKERLPCAQLSGMYKMYTSLDGDSAQ